MKRDMELIKKILTFSEDNYTTEYIPVINPTNPQNPMNLFQTDEACLRYHIQMLKDHGLIDSEVCCFDIYATSDNGELYLSSRTPNAVVTIGALTWQGADFLEDLQNPLIWKMAKKLGDISFRSLIAAIPQLGVEAIKLTLGLS